MIQPASQTTTVFCSGNTATTVLEKFCLCVDAGPAYLKRLNKNYIFSNGTTKEFYLGDYRSMKECDATRLSSDVCND